MKMRFTLIFTVLLTASLFTFAQTDLNHGLVLRGQIYDFERENHEKYIVWKARLAMEFINEGSSPIILINPQGQFGKWQSKVSFFMPVRGCGNDCKNYVFAKDTHHENDNSLEYRILTESLNTPEPTQNLTINIKQGEKLTFDDQIELIQKFEKGKRNEIVWEGPKFPDYRDRYDTYPLACYPYLTIRYEISLLKYQDDANLLENLQTRWGQFGFFPVDLNGGFSITSENIKNTYGSRLMKKE